MLHSSQKAVSTQKLEADESDSRFRISTNDKGFRLPKLDSVSFI